jgi:hypothetical protein
MDERMDAVQGGVKRCTALVLHVLRGHHLQTADRQS